MTAHDQLRSFCGMTFRHGFTATPFVIAGHVYGTDAKALVRLPAPSHSDTEGVPTTFVRQLGQMWPNTEPTEFDVDDLRQWLGPVERGPICYHCGVFDPPPDPMPPPDSAWWSQERHPVSVGPGCDFCTGGYDRPEAVPVRVFGAYFDRHYLRQFLALPCTANVLCGTFGQLPPLPAKKGVTFADRPASMTVGEARLLLMPMQPSNPKVIETYAPGIGRLWHLRTTNRRCVLIDWCMERGLDLTDLEGVPF